jgi:DNA repair protein RecN (Recombination protein N)
MASVSYTSDCHVLHLELMFWLVGWVRLDAPFQRNIMLKQLTLKNFVLVESLDIDFGGGLTTITGESGAGKSILLNALGLLLGERARVEVIRPGADKADVSAEFDLSGLPTVRAQLAADELAVASPAASDSAASKASRATKTSGTTKATDSEEANTCLVRRVLSAQGRSRAFINGVPVTTQYLRDLGEQLVDIHGQNEHVRLANRTTQLAMLDDYASLNKVASEVTALYRTWQTDLAAIQTLQNNLSAATDRRDLLSYQLRELEEFDLQPDEFGSLDREHKRLSQAHTILASLQNGLTQLEELDDLRHSVAEINAIDDDNADLVSAQSTLKSVIGLLDDATRDLRHYQDHVVVDPETLKLLEERLNTVQDLARKHRINPDQLVEHTDALSAELTAIDADGSTLDELLARADERRGAYLKKAQTLSNKRKKAAPRFAKAVSGYMQLLGITQGEFEVCFEAAEGEHGLERVEFHVTTNPNFPAGPLTQIASGGEQTRIGLSIQIVAAENSALPCLILDEADVGVGGTTADTVGRILRDLGQHTQVISVTQAPQVAAVGDNHYRGIKTGANTDIHTLDDERRVEELARMLAGADITHKTREYAQTLLQEANRQESAH